MCCLPIIGKVNLHLNTKLTFSVTFFQVFLLAHFAGLFRVGTLEVSQ